MRDLCFKFAIGTPQAYVVDMKYLSATILSFIALISTASAHPTGHESSLAANTKHLLTQPDHLLFILGSLTIATLIGLSFRKARKAPQKR